MNLYFDTETTGLPQKGLDYHTDYNLFPHVVQLSWEFNGKERDYIIRPDGWEIPQSATDIHGITTQMALTIGTPFEIVIPLFIQECLMANKIVGYNIYFDTSIIKANILRIGDENLIKLAFEALDKSKRVDIMYKAMKVVKTRQPNGSGKFPSLEEAYLALFGETFQAHNAICDVMATKKVCDKLIEVGVL